MSHALATKNIYLVKKKNADGEHNLENSKKSLDYYEKLKSKYQAIRKFSDTDEEKESTEEE